MKDSITQFFDFSSVKMQLPLFHFNPHPPDPFDWTGILLTFSLSTLSVTFNYINLENLDALVVFFIHCAQFLTTVIAAIIGLLTARRIWREQKK